MRKFILLLVSLPMLNLFLYSQTRSAYQIDLRTASIIPRANVQEKTINDFNLARKSGSVTAILQFREHLTPMQKKSLAGSGIHLLNYIGGRAYVVNATQALSLTSLQKAGARSLLAIQPSQKIHESLLTPSAKNLQVQVSLFPVLPFDQAIKTLNEKGFVTRKVYGNYPVLEVTVPPGKIMDLASLPFVEFIDVLPLPPVELNDKSEAGTRANVLQSPDYGLTGEGVTFQINEFNSFPQGHVDFIDRSVLGQTQTTSNYHQTHVTGIAAGAGLIDERYKGYAPKARFISSGPFAINEANLVNYGVDLTNNSYGSGRGCADGPNVNTTNSWMQDKMALDFPWLLNIYAAGNYGGTKCPLYPVGYNTIDVNSQTTKSILTVGSTDTDGILAGYSSKGPVFRSRLKPEIVAPGSAIWSTVPTNIYNTNNGTSMAAPAVMGGLGLLYQRYMQLHGGAKPESALMKPLLCNAATDKGTIGPDYGYGFGLMNLNRAIQILDAGQYFKDSVGHQRTKTKLITVPSGTHLLKVMLYWNDRPASPLTSKLLINDLDLQVTTPQATTVLPFVPDTLPSQVANPASRGADHSNNIEQVIIEQPQAGTYAVEVKGYEVTEGEFQDYYVVYDLVPDAVQLTFPSAGQNLVPGETVGVQWESWGALTSTFKLELSKDNGQSWETIDAAIQAGSTGYNWVVPQMNVTAALLRITRNEDGKRALSGTFHIIGVPTLKLQTSQCPGSIAVEWSAVPGATDYEVMWIRNGEMQSVGKTSGTTYLFNKLAEDSTYWITVRARINDVPGRRAVALSRKPITGDCADPAHDGELKMESLLSPLFGRRYTSKQLGVEPIKVRIRNLDNALATGFAVSYSVDNGPWINETYTETLSPLTSDVYVFKTPFDFGQPGNYTIRVAISGTKDNTSLNDTLQYDVRNVANDPIPLAVAAVEDLENAVVADYKFSSFGIGGDGRYDYNKSGSPTEILRVGSHHQQNPTTGFELMYSSTPGSSPGTHSLLTTYNLSKFDTSLHSVGLDFTYAHVPSTIVSTDSLLMRGNDTAAWIYMHNLNQSLSPNGEKKFNGIAVGDSLRAHKQNFSSSFQLKWAPSSSTATILLDNIKLYNTSSDLSVQIDSVAATNCSLSAATPVHITVRNRGRVAAENVVVSYKADNGSDVTEKISQVPAQSELLYTFSQQADLSAIGVHTLRVKVEGPADNFAENNVEQVEFRNLPLVKNFPNLEDFENSDGGWYTEGKNTSWEWGTPASLRINSAASGKNAWKTNLDGNYNANELSYLYTGCYDLSQLSKPVISVSAALNMDSCIIPLYCDMGLFQYSSDGVNWRNVPNNSLHKWPNLITSFVHNRWHVMSLRLPDTLKNVRFRFQFRSNSVNQFEGFGLDDFHVYDSTALIYDGPSAVVTQVISGRKEWIEYRKEGKLIAAIQPNNQHMGNVTVKTFTASGDVRNFHGQKYLNRNLLWSSSNPVTDPVTMRVYFTDKEADSLLLSRSCLTCTKPFNAYGFGLSTYTSVDPSELDSSIANNRKGEWNFIPNRFMKTVPFANGYYVEFEIKNHGELRLSNGGLDGLSDLPVHLDNFKTQRIASGVSIQWQTASEINLSHFEVEVAENNKAFAMEQFQKLGEVPSKGRSTRAQAYNFTDRATNKTGVWFYRIKSVDIYGNSTYSEAAPVFFTDELECYVYPNPTREKTTLVYQAAAGTVLKTTLYNSIGIMLDEARLTSTGFVQKHELNFGTYAMAGGIYYLRISDGQNSRLLRIVKQ